MTAGLILAAAGQNPGDAFTNFIRQKQYPSGFERDVYVSSAGQRLSELAIDPGGARFELWTVKTNASAQYLLDTRFVSAYIPIATVAISTGDPYTTIPRTRADRPFTVSIQISGMSSDPSAQEAARRVRFLRHVQSYGATGTGEGIDRSQATLHTQSFMDSNGTFTTAYSLTAIPASNLSKVRGEERFSVFSLEDYQAPASQLASKYVQVWPVADGEISGIASGASLRFDAPTLTFTMNDLYPDSRTYAQIYPGPAVLGTQGTVIPGSALIIYDTVPHNRTLVVTDWDEVIRESGQYTIELLTVTPFGTDRLHHVTFNINRDINVNATVSTVE